MLRKMALVLCALAMVILFVGCGEQEILTENSFITNEGVDAVWYAGVINDEPVILAEGKKTLIGTEIQEILPSYLQGKEALTIVFNAQPTESQEDISRAPIPLGFGYWFRFELDKHRLGACINRNNVPHVNIAITKNGLSGSVVDLHIAVWTENGRLCGALWATKYNRTVFCWSACSPSFWDMHNAVKTALIIVGIPYFLAYYMAYIITVTSLALLPIGL